MLDVRGLTVTTLAELIRLGEHTSREITQAYLQRIDALNPGLNAYLEVYDEEALKAAENADAEIGRGEHRGPLHGVPVAVKDIMDIQGKVTTAGGILLPDVPAREDAPVIEKLREAGAILLGKLNLHEFAWGGTTNNVHYGKCWNPWKKGYSPGGSSGGSGAAVSASLCAAALGTDTLGSVRIPASYSGCVGLKPTNGSVSCRGVYPLSWSLDNVGPLARRVQDAAIVFNAIKGFDPRDPYAQRRSADPVHVDENPSIEGLRVGIIRDWTLVFNESAPERLVAECVSAAIERLTELGAVRVDLDVPEITAISQAAFVIALADAALIHKDHMNTAPESIGEDVRQRLEIGAALKGVDVADAFHIRQEQRLRFETLLQTVDVLVTPTTATASHPFDPALATGTAKFTAPVNLLGLPAVSVPCGFTDEGLPVGMMVVSGPFREETALRVAQTYENATPWKDALPDDEIYLA